MYARGVRKAGWPLVAVLLLSGTAGQVMASPDVDGVAIIPTPKSLTLDGGSLAIAPGNSVLYADAQLEPLARVLVADFGHVHGVKLAVAEAGTPRKGDIVLQFVKAEAVQGHYDSHVITVADHVAIQADTYNGIAMGMMTVLQAARGDAKGVTIPRMTVGDYGDRGFRALQVSIRGGYHSPQWVKRVIDVMRFYKVRVLQLHTAEALWVGAVMESSNGADPKLLQKCSAWNKKEMDDVIAYACQRGVSLLPHNEMRPNDTFWPPALTTKFNPADKYADYVDEIDGKGEFQIKGGLAEDPRFWDFVQVVTQRSCDQFAKGWPDGKLPYYHIGPVYGEGGCSGKQAAKMLGFLTAKNPDIRMMYWNGPGEGDSDLAPHKKNIAVAFYSATWGGTPEGLLAAGYELSNVSWAPLYVLPGSRMKARKQGKWIFDEFHIGRFGAEGVFGEPIKARDCTKWQSGIVGGMLATWEFPSAAAGGGHLEMITPCIPFFAEHIWNVQPWPYPKGAWEKISADLARVSPLVDCFVREDRPPSPPDAVTATRGVLPAAVDVFWGESDNYPSYYQVLRADAADSGLAQPISGKIPASFVTQLNVFRDEKVTAGRRYYYWVRGNSPMGASEFGRPAEGFTGDGVALPAAYEPFDYPAGAALDKLDGGAGFKTAWKVDEFNAPLTITTGGLTFPGLKTSGRALHVEATDADEKGGRRPPHIRIQRTLATPYGQDGTQVWSSFLIRAQRPAIGDLAVNIGRTGIGKTWGSGISVCGDRGGGDLLANKTYFIVVRYTFHKGNDLIHMWVNPTPGRQPADTDAAVVTRNYDNPADDKYSISMQPYGKGSYDIDELRVGAAYGDVAPADK